MGANDGNRLTYLDSADPFYPNLALPRFVTPQWIGEPGVDAVVILSIDDLRTTPKYEEHLRPIIERLKKIDGRAPVSIMCNQCPVDDPQFVKWLAEGVTPEVHTLTHPCPFLGKEGFAAAAHTYHGCVDLMARIPGNHPVAFRMPCCDSMNSASPRFFSEVFQRTSDEGAWLAIDSSVMLLFTPQDPALPRELVVEGDRERFRKYFQPKLVPPRKSLEAFEGYIEDYPYPYVINRVCWEFPCAVPSDWEAFNLHAANNPATTEDWKAGLEACVIKEGVLTLVLHPHGWSTPQQVVELIDHAVTKYGPRVKFLTFREALARLERNALGGDSLRAKDGGDNGVRLIDVNRDGYMDVLIGNDRRKVTRIWQPRDRTWRETDLPVPLVGSTKFGADSRFGVVRNGAVTLVASGEGKGAWEFEGKVWHSVTELLGGLDAVSGVATGAIRLRDFNRDGRCEVLVSHPQQNAVYGWSEEGKQWQLLDYSLPEGVRLVNERGEDNGLRFVDLNSDGFDDVLFSNEGQVAIHLWAKHVREVLGWKPGWPHEVVHARRGENPQADKIPPITREGRNNGAWLHNGHLVVQNEETASLPDVVWRKSFRELIAFDMPPSKSPEESLKCLRARPGFRVELVAAEPLVVDPIAFDWDAAGRLWVVEMRDYPLGMDGNGQPGGMIKVLDDSDRDGCYDRATVFLDGLPFPTGLIPWRKGVIVAASPDIFYAEDTDGDGRADLRRALFSGFAPGNQQHRLNGFEWGLDGWLYGANGDSGGKVKSSATGAAVDISGRDFRFLPDSGEFETVSGATQFGRHRNDWGDWFGNNNPTWLWHITVPEHYLRRNPRLAVKSVRRVLANGPEGTRVFAISATLPRFNQPETLGHVTSANSATPYRDDLFGPSYATSVFVSEPVYNVVHREVLEAEGATFTSRRADDERDREFLASTDHWFRPTMLKTGPDGALYIADMYRAVLEHPEWIAPETQARIDVRAGDDKGRMYRVFPENATLPRISNLSALDTAGLVAALDSPNGWQRDTAQRLLFERADKSSAAGLVQLAANATSPKVRLQALATLDLIGASAPGVIIGALCDGHPAVRAQALRSSELFAGKSGELFDAVLAVEDDPDFSVRRQLAFSLGAWPGPVAARLLDRLAEREGGNEEMRVAILSSVRQDSPLMARLRDKPAKSAASAPLPQIAATPSPERAKIVESYAGVSKLRGESHRGHELFRQACSMCHRLKGEGFELGPDLAMTADKPLDWLLMAIFDPNAAIEARYQVQRVTTQGGTEIIGVVAAETANNLTLRTPGGIEQAVLRSEIKERAPLGRSLMPEGLEAALKPQDVADLLAWVRARQRRK
ncbi:MAG: PVC-type heme-binding CxxCH protein [Verrucomicrobiales bacterium]